MQEDEVGTGTLPPSPKPKRVGGWLILVAFGLVVGPIQVLAQLTDVLNAFSGDTWTNLTSPSSPSYHPSYSSILSFELVGNLCLLALQILAFFGFVLRSQRFPRIYVCTLLFSLGIFVVDQVIASRLPGASFNANDGKAIVQAIFGCLIWIPYMIISKRVKATFVVDDGFTPIMWRPRWFASATAGLLAIAVFALTRSFESAPSAPDLQKQASAEKSTTEIATAALNSLVAVESLGKNGKVTGIGSGFYILPDIVVTNFHVIDGASNIEVRRPNVRTGSPIQKVLAVDSSADLALLLVSEKNQEFLQIGSSEEIKIGETVYAAGNPEGLEGTFSNGLVSNRQSIDGVEMLQVTAPVSHGSSGGPILGPNGKVVAVAAAFFSKGQNLNLGVPSVYIARLIARTEYFYPLAKSGVLASNPTIVEMLPEVCDRIIDLPLPEKYFVEFTQQEFTSKGIDHACQEVLPSCKRAWFNKKTKSFVFVGSQALPNAGLENLGRADFEKEVSNLVGSTKEAYRATNPETKFVVSQNDVTSHIIRYDLSASYLVDGSTVTDFRSMYFVLPFCRMDVLISSSEASSELDGALTRILGDVIIENLPGAKAERALFKFAR